MIYKFHAYGHPNILASHKTTLEFTKDENVTLKGNCIVGVKADFELEKLKKSIKNSKDKKIKIIIEFNGEKEEINAEINPGFNSNGEMVIRKTDFVSDRTFAIKADKAAIELDRKFTDILKKRKECTISVVVPVLKQKLYI